MEFKFNNNLSGPHNKGLIKSIDGLYDHRKNIHREDTGSGTVTSTTNGQMYFFGTVRKQYLPIQWIPENVEMVRSSDTQPVKVIGRNNPFYHYTTGETLLSMRLDFYSEVDARTDVIERCRWLESFVMNDGFSKPPEPVKLVWGDLFKDEVWVVKFVNYKLSNFNKSFGYLPQQAHVDITLALDLDANSKVDDLRKP